VAGAVLVKIFFHTGVFIKLFEDNSAGLRIIGNNELLDRFGYFLDNLFHALGLLGGRDLISVSGFLYFIRLICIVVMIMLVRKIRKKTSPDNVAGIVLLISAILSALTMTLIELEVDLTSRYLFPIMLLLGVTISVIVNYFISNKHMFFAVATCVIVLSVSMVNISSGSSFYVGRDLKLEEERKIVADFLVETGLPIGYGVAWQGKVLEPVADYQFTILHIFNSVDELQYRGVTLPQMYHDNDEVFLVLSAARADDALECEDERAILETGTRYDLADDKWVVYLFGYNPWRLERE
jgi:hypothetical protein